uniref:Sterol 3-beta-glucosyltransferase UGT80A2 isoform X1 n=2 Tax=Rhizophora mucronata TaxID=61149 RepID=A0A2P2LCR1_RHIMU
MTSENSNHSQFGETICSLRILTASLTPSSRRILSAISKARDLIFGHNASLMAPNSIFAPILIVMSSNLSGTRWFLFTGCGATPSQCIFSAQ